MKILITGGAGFIGSHIADAALRAGHEVVIVDDLSAGSLDNISGALNAGARFIELDICSPKLREVFLREKPDLVNHHAAQKSVRLSVENPAEDARINTLGLLNVLEACRASACKRIIFASSGGVVYGEQSQFPATESHPFRPLSPYGVSKLSSEFYLDYYALQFGFSAVALRYANIYGPRQDPQGEAGVVAIFCSRMIEGADTVIYGDGQQTRDFVYVDDVVAANLAATQWIAKQADGVYRAWNIGTAEETTILRLHEILAKHSHTKAQLHFEVAKSGEQKRSVLSFERAQSDLGWSPQVSIESGLQFTLQWFANRPQGLGQRQANNIG